MDYTKNSICLYAPAKINLFLHVVGKRSDGYHNLITWMQKIDLCDVITLELSSGDGIIFNCNSSEIPLDRSNLAVVAAEAFFSASSRSDGCALKIFLEKKIPAAAGLGGGSSDAGTVLKGLNILFENEFSEAELIVMARSLGADVPFFVVDHAAVIAEGIGDVMKPVESLTNVMFVLVNTNIFVSTAWVFQNLTLTSAKKNSRLSCFQKCDAVSLSLDLMHNDLEQVTSKRYSEIDQIKKTLLTVGASRVLMSGSGSTVFGVFPKTDNLIGIEMTGIVEKIHKQYGEKVFLCSAITGAWPSGKAPGFDPGIRRFEPCRPSQ